VLSKVDIEVDVVAALKASRIPSYDQAVGCMVRRDGFIGCALDWASSFLAGGMWSLDILLLYV